MCSIDGGALRRVAEAIDRLEADRRNTDAADLEARIAAVWSMVSGPGSRRSKVPVKPMIALSGVRSS